MEKKTFKKLGGEHQEIKDEKQPLSELAASENLTEGQWEKEARMLRKKVAGYKSYVSQTNKMIDELRKTIEKCETEDIRKSVIINSLENRVKELIDGNNSTIESLNIANDEVFKLKRRLRDIEEMPWWRRIFLD